jgi:tetrahydromethanopterin S-methyltransferase subunit B
MATEKVIKLKVENGEAVLAVDELNKALKETNKNTDNLNEAVEAGTESLDKFTKGGVSAMKGLYKGVQTAVGSMKTLKGAIIATGIGALVAVVGSLAAYFTKTEEGGDKLNVIMSAMGAVISKLTDIVFSLGEKILSVFENPKKALQDFGKLLKENLTNRVQGLLELIPSLGKAIGLVLKGQFKEAGKVAVDAVGKVGLGVENVTDKIGAAGKALVDFGKSAAAAAAEGARIGNILNDVEDAERELLVLRAKANKQIIEARFIADDLTKSTEERVAAVQRASKLEEQVFAKELKAARQKAQALKDQAKLAKPSEEALVAIAEAQARVLDLEADSIRRQKKLQSEINSLRNEEKTRLAEVDKVRADAQKKEEDYLKFIMQGDKELIESLNQRRAAQIKSLEEFQAALNRLRGVAQTEKEKELAQIDADAKAALDALIASGKATADQAAIITAEQRKAERLVNEKYDKLDRQRQLENNAKKLELAGQAFGALAQLAESFSKDDEKNAKRAFGITKALRLGEAVANTAAAIMTQLAVPQDALTGANFVKAGIVAVTGAAQIATIARSKYQPSGGSAETPSVGSVSTPAGGGGFTPNISFTGIGQNPLSGIFDRPMQAYVVNQQMNNNNMLERRIRTSSNFGG